LLTLSDEYLIINKKIEQGDVAGLEAISCILPQMFIRSRMFLLLLNPPYPQNVLLWAGFIY
jgi:hypothetical protein